MAEELPMRRRHHFCRAPGSVSHGAAQFRRAKSRLALVAGAWAAGCGVFPLEVDTPQLNEHAIEDLKQTAANGSCKAGTFQGNVTGGKDFTGQCIIQGNLYVTGDATDLLRLRHVREVQGAIYFGGAVDLADALPDLRKCNGIFASGYTGTTLTGPPALETASGLTIEKNGSLETISGFDGVTDMGIHLRSNQALTSVSGFAKLASGVVTIEDNPKLASFAELPALAHAVAMSFQRCPLLLELPACPALKTVDGDLQVREMPGNAIEGFPELQNVGGLKVTQMPNLTSLKLPSLTKAPTLWLVELAKLGTLVGLPQVQVSGVLSTCKLALCKLELDAFVQAHAPGAKWILCDFWEPCAP